ncbi:cupin domain-containing protein [Fulvivirgaceae bacterium PWU4]|uniref:Cupin domain-containing protein n=1 Tax=Chryseosolibacter histidini TaxID=2782349 RepID=A0AAP2DT13_9BACT|nr:cupin domain-containing protein [Chryseosolibacter histidini]MBT1700783.1 cupin domain-containing protein [Chryseosolibacter histidini]
MRSLFFSLVILSFAAQGELHAQHHAPAAGSSTVVTNILQQVLNDPGLAGREVKMLIVDYPPGSTTPAHRHPCPTFGYVLEGEIESTFEGKARLYKKGDSFYEFTNGLHNSARNPHPTEPAKLLVFFIAEKDKPTYLPEK